MGLSRQISRILLYSQPVEWPACLVSGSIGNAARYGKRLRVIDAMAGGVQTRLTAAKAVQFAV
jgi:hypothetical protein